MNEIIPGILEHEWSEIEKKLQIVRQFSPTVHIDLIDGQFASNTTFLDPAPFAQWAEALTIEVHMMVQEPIHYVDSWGGVGVKRFLGHIEQMSDQEAFLAKAKKYGEGGLALDGKTTVGQIQVPFSQLDTVLVMAIDAGFSGQDFVGEYAKKCEEIQTRAPELCIEVDGGMNLQTIPEVRKMGASRFVCTSALFSNANQQEAYTQLTEAL